MSQHFAAGLLRLYTQLEWIQETVERLSTFRTGPMSTFADRAFVAEINNAIRVTEVCRVHVTCAFKHRAEPLRKAQLPRGAQVRLL